MPATTFEPLDDSDICLNCKQEFDRHAESDIHGSLDCPTVHTVRGLPIGPEGVAYGTTHDMSCPACQDTPFTASPRSETYWAS